MTATKRSLPPWVALGAALLLVASGGAGAGERIAVPVGDSPTLGPEGAPVTVVEFVDYQ